MAKHTPTPWKNDHSKIYSTARPGFMAIIGEFTGIMTNRTEDVYNAKRAVECVNALDGIDDPAQWVKESNEARIGAVSSHKHVVVMKRQVDDLTAWGNKADEMIGRLQSALQGTVNALQALPPSVLDDAQLEALNDATEILTELRLAQEGGSDA